ncbi:MAG: PD-(D/E)XK nuclease family protein [Christensenellales bacterium]|jgi:hypothetical protein
MVQSNKVSKDRLNEAVKILRERKEEVEKAPGARFNVFSVLRMERREVETHSLFLYELLNPEGSHGCGDLFLQQFCEIVLPQSCFGKGDKYVAREVAFSESSRPDFVIEDERACAIIEMKIDAGDQTGQLTRYADYRNGDAILYYLTLDGRSPSENATRGMDKGESEDLLFKKKNENGERKVRIVCISFKDDIKGWLKACTDQIEYPNVKEVCKQYASLCDVLARNFKEDSKIMKLIETKEQYKAVLALRKEMPNVRKTILLDFFTRLQTKLEGAFKSENQYAVVPITDELENAIQCYYTQSIKAHPSLEIEIIHDEYKSIRFYIETETYLYLICKDKDESIEATKIESKAIREKLEVLNRDLISKKGWCENKDGFGCWKYINGTDGKRINFSDIDALIDDKSIIGDDLKVTDAFLEHIAKNVVSSFKEIKEVLQNGIVARNSEI